MNFGAILRAGCPWPEFIALLLTAMKYLLPVLIDWAVRLWKRRRSRRRRGS